MANIHKTKIQYLDVLILLLLIGVTFVDTLNGPLLRNELPSISKPYKFLILALMVLRIAASLKINRIQFLITISFFCFFLGYFSTFIVNGDFLLFIQNFIESIKYLIWPTSFVYFSKLYANNTNSSKLVFKIIIVSYLVIIANIFLGILGFGYQFYPRYNTGVKGFFYSGNEFSLLFILLTFYIACRCYFISQTRFYIFILFSLFLAFNIGSKTTIMGVAGIFLIVLISNTKMSLLKIKPQKLLIYGVISLVLPVVTFLFFKANRVYFDEFIFKRLEIYNYDFVTWFLSKRNLVAKEGIEEFYELPWFFKIFGQGEATFQSNFDIVEIDFLDLLFNHGYLGFICFLVLILVVFKALVRRKKDNSFTTGLVYLYILIMFFLSNLSGHIINTGIPGFFLGMIFAMCHDQTITKKPPSL